MRWSGFPVVLVAFAACVETKPAAAPIEVAPVAAVGSSGTPEPLPPPDPTRSDRFPGGPGVTLVVEQLRALVSDPKIFSMQVTDDDRIAAVQYALGVPGEARKEGANDAVSFLAVGPRTPSGPWSCSELILVKQGAPRWQVRATDFPRCGLPYAEDHATPYTGPGPKRTVGALKKVVDTVGFNVGPIAQLQGKQLLGAHDDVGEGIDQLWFGIGGRDANAPITCHSLRIGATKTELEKTTLARCGITWGPPPAARFRSGPPVPPIDKPAALVDCAKSCKANEVCTIEQRGPSGALLRNDPDGQRAHYPDGYPAPTQLITSCTPIPLSCSMPATSACFFGTPAQRTNGPCPTTGKASGGHSFQSLPSPHIVCFTHVD